MLFGKPMGQHQQCATTAEQSLGERAYTAAWRKGSSLPPDDAVAYALGEQQRLPAASETAALTKREREVAELVSRGMTNSAIAAKLVISQRTVQGHVEHILSKLGFNSRTQVAAWVLDQERGDDHE